MKSILARALVVFAPFVVACGGSVSGASTTPQELEDRPVTGDACAAEYGRARDLTIVAVDLGSIGVTGVALPGDGWTVDCSPAQDALLTATNEPASRIMTITIDREVVGPIDIARYANEHVTAMRADGRLPGLTVADPLVAETGYALMSRLDQASGTLFDLAIWELLPTPEGALRMHLSEFSPDPQTIEAHADLLAECGDSFRLGSASDE